MAIETMAIEKVEIEGYRSESSKAIETAKQLAREIKDNVTLDAAVKMLLMAKSAIKKITERLNEPKRAARVAWQSISALENELVEPYERIEVEILKPAISRFTTEQEKIRRANQERLNAEAKKREEDERLAAALEHEQRGDKEIANSVLASPAPVAPVTLPKAYTPEGISYREVWRYRIIDGSKIPREYLSVDEQKIGGVVRSLKGETRIEGVEVYSEQIVAGRV